MLEFGDLFAHGEKVFVGDALNAAYFFEAVGLFDNYSDGVVVLWLEMRFCYMPT